MRTKKAFPIFFALLAVTSLSLTAANPIPAPMIYVASPQNNFVYPTNTVAINFTPLAHSGVNFSSYSYSLDGQPAKATYGYTQLMDLSPGSHVLEIYGSQHDDSQIKNMLLARVYFSSAYSTAWVTFTAVSTALGALFSFAVFMNRKKLSTRLRAEKTGSFWLGVVCFAVSIIGLIPSAWWYLDLYLFPHYPRGVAIPPLPFLVLSFVGLAAAFALMAYGTRRKAA